MIQSKNRIFYKAAADFKENQYSMYQIYLLHNGYWIFTIGDEKCYINSNCIFCTDNRTKIEVLFHQGKEAECIAFSLENSDQYRSSELLSLIHISRMLFKNSSDFSFPYEKSIISKKLLSAKAPTS